MTTTTTTNAEADALLIAENAFLKELVQQMRSQDHYGVFRTWEDRLVIANFIVTKKRKKEIPVTGDVDPATQLRILSFYRAIAASIEKSTGKLCQVVLDLSHEGFGWSLVWSGRLMVVCRTVRDAHRFGFESLDKLASEGEKMVKRGIELIECFPDVANL